MAFYQKLKDLGIKVDIALVKEYTVTTNNCSCGDECSCPFSKQVKLVMKDGSSFTKNYKQVL